jgi:hypothetical protein
VIYFVHRALTLIFDNIYISGAHHPAPGAIPAAPRVIIPLKPKVIYNNPNHHENTKISSISAGCLYHPQGCLGPIFRRGN